MISRTEARRQSARTNPSEWNDSWNTLWMEGGPTRLLHFFIDSHVKSLSRDPEPANDAPGPKRLKSSWLGMGTSADLYLNGVLGFWNAGDAVGGKHLVQVLSMLVRDIDATRPTEEKRARSPDGDLWFWKVFVAIHALRRTIISSFANRTDKMLEGMRAHLVACMRHWSDLAGVLTWEDARAALQRIVWVSETRNDNTGMRIWVSNVTLR